MGLARWLAMGQRDYSEPLITLVSLLPSALPGGPPQTHTAAWVSNCNPAGLHSHLPRPPRPPPPQVKLSGVLAAPLGRMAPGAAARLLNEQRVERWFARAFSPAFRPVAVAVTVNSPGAHAA